MINRQKNIITAIACISALTCIPALLSCRQAPRAKDPIVQVGQTVIGQASFEAFQKTANLYPAPLPYYFPSQRLAVTFMAESEAIYQYTHTSGIGEKVASSLDWAWKKRYYTAAPFFELMSSDNLGFSDAELKTHYNKHKEDFRVTVVNAAGADSSFIPPFNDVKRHVADALFYEKHKPDQAFISRFDAQDLDSAALRNQWMYHVRVNPTDFYMRLFFSERTGEAYESIEQIYCPSGTKEIVSDDIDVIRSWVPPSRRSMRIPELIEWLYKWKIFAEHSEKTGLTNTAEHKNILHWAMRIEHATMYLQEEVLSSVTQEIQPHLTDLAQLIIYDQDRNTENQNQRRLQEELDKIHGAKITVAVDSTIYKIREIIGITFMQDEHKDDRSSSVAELIAKADALKESAAEINNGAEDVLREAENIYRTIAVDFVFTAEGRRAMSEVAKLQIDRYNSDASQERLLWSAIASYRRGQVVETDMDALCNSLFMTGFTFDEYLKNYALAEANYKWILRHTPNCALAADAEFMLLHLGEPMTSIEEIQGQSRRQGRQTDFDEELAL